MRSIICKEPGCDDDVYGQGWCEKHYWRVRRHGDPNKRLRRANGEGGLRNNGTRLWFQRNGKKIQEAVLIVEKILGHPLPKGAIVHHVDENPLNNANSNLIVCQGQGLHNIIHGRLNALKACGNARWKPCQFCKQYDDPANLIKNNATAHCHAKCKSEWNIAYQKNRRAVRKGMKLSTPTLGSEKE